MVRNRVEDGIMTDLENGIVYAARWEPIPVHSGDTLNVEEFPSRLQRNINVDVEVDMIDSMLGNLKL